MPKDTQDSKAPRDVAEAKAPAEAAPPKLSDKGRRAMQGAEARAPEPKAELPRAETGAQDTPKAPKRVQDMLQHPENGTLKRDMNLHENLGIEKGYAGHHLLPCDVAQSSKVMKEAAKKGYNINNEHNVEPLPTTSNEARKTGKPLHEGRHVPEYTGKVAADVKALNSSYLAAKRAGRSWTDAQLLTNIDQLENKTRKGLLSGDLYLNDKDPNLKNRTKTGA
jgi:hypothetical protein